MLWFRGIMVVAAVTLSIGCGFRPLYGPPLAGEKGASAELAAIDVAPIPDRSGQQLRTSLEALLDPGYQRVPRRYHLAVELKEDFSDSAVERTGFATRGDLRIEARFKLVDTTTDTVVIESSARAASSFNVLPPSPFADYSTYTAASSARSRLLEQLAHEIRQRLATYFSARPVGAAGTG